jgi:hypothetical protein
MISINNQQRDLEIHIDSHTCIQQRPLRWTTMSGFINPVYEFLYLEIFYLPEIRSLASPYLVQSRSKQVLFTCSAIQYHPVIKIINHVFTNGVWYWLPSGPRVYLSFTGGINLNLDTYNPTSTFRSPERHLYDHPFIVWCLMISKLSSGTSTTREKPIRRVHILAIRGVSLYATGKTPLVHAYPWRTGCMPRLRDLPVAYMLVRHGYKTH